jgi:octaprenyl-diphosphate synthase
MIESFLEKVEQRVRATLDQDLLLGREKPQILQTAARHIAFSGGKRMRSRLIYFYGQILGLEEQALVDIALAVELIHTASLLHDDIVDEGKVRRGQPTVNARWGNLVAVLTGDLMLSLAISVLKPYPREITNEAVDMVVHMTRAAMMEVEARGRLDLGLSFWHEIAEGKTATVFAFCGRACAHLAGNTLALEQFSKCGEHLGVAFQLTDDLKDLQGSEAGKERFADIRNGNPSYPVWYLMEQHPEIRAEWEEYWQAPHLHPEKQPEELGELLLSKGAADVAEQVLHEEVEAALNALGPFLDGEAGQTLHQWIQAMVATVFLPVRAS